MTRQGELEVIYRVAKASTPLIVGLQQDMAEVNSAQVAAWSRGVGPTSSIDMALLYRLERKLCLLAMLQLLAEVQRKIVCDQKE